jgi:hypothetical protein
MYTSHLPFFLVHHLASMDFEVGRGGVRRRQAGVVWMPHTTATPLLRRLRGKKTWCRSSTACCAGK